MDEFQNLAISCTELCELNPLGFSEIKRNLKQVSYIKEFNLFCPVLLPQTVEPNGTEPILLEKSNQLFFIGPAFNVWTINYEIDEDGVFQTSFANPNNAHKVRGFVPCPATALNKLLSSSRQIGPEKVVNELLGPEDIRNTDTSKVRLFSSKRKRTKKFYFDIETFEIDLFCYAMFFGEYIKVSEELAVKLDWRIDSSKDLAKDPVQLATHRTKFVEVNLIAAIDTLF